MPRKQWLLANRYCRNARLDEEEFALLVWLWLGGHSARSARGMFSELGHTPPPSVKTTARYFRRFGYVLSEMTIEREFITEFPAWGAVRNSDLALYIETFEFAAREAIEKALGSYEYKIYRELHGERPFIQTTGDVDLEIRHISALRYGIRSPYRGDLALAAFRIKTKATLAKDASDEEFHRVMAESFLIELEERPMDISRYRWR